MRLVLCHTINLQLHETLHDLHDQSFSLTSVRRDSKPPDTGYPRTKRQESLNLQRLCFSQMVLFQSFHCTIFRDVHQTLIFMHHSLKHYSKDHTAGAAMKKYTTAGDRLNGGLVTRVKILGINIVYIVSI